MFQVFAQDVTAQDDKEVVVLVNSYLGLEASIVKNFTMMNPSEFYGSKIKEDPQNFINAVFVNCYDRSNSHKNDGIFRLQNQWGW